MMLNTRFIADVGLPRYAWRTALRQFSKRVLRTGNRLRLPTGCVVDLPRVSRLASEVYVSNANVDWGSEALLVRHLDPEGCFFDIGANIGYYALYVAPAVRSVFAFEPDPRNWAALEANARHADNITVVRKAVGREPGTGALDVSRHSDISFLRPGGGEGVAVTADVTTVDEFSAGLAGAFVTGIKIDVEGLDLDVLRGAERTLRDQQPLVLTEFTLEAGRSNDPNMLFDIAAQSGYAIFAYVRAGTRYGKTEFRLRAIDREAFDRQALKMLFLVPSRLRAVFAGEARV